MGVLPQYQGRGIEALLNQRTIEKVNFMGTTVRRLVGY